MNNFILKAQIKINGEIMKKVLLSILIVLVAVTMIGCNNKTSKAITNLKNEIESTEQTVFSSYVREVSDISNPAYYKMSSSDELKYHKYLTYENLSREEELRQQVITMSSFLKSNYNENLKLNKNQLNTLQTLTGNLKKYNEQLKNTKNDLVSFSNCIKSNIKDNNINCQETETCFVTLNNSLNERYMCLCNIFNNLEEIYILFFNDNDTILKQEEKENTTLSIDDKKTYISDKIIEENKNEDKGLKKNIDSYNPYKNTNQELPPINNNTNSINNPNIQSDYMNSPANNNYPYNYNYNNFYNYRFNPYGYNFNRFNPSRNTDTFYSLNRNIDTYRFSPSIYKNQNIYNYPQDEILASYNYDNEPTSSLLTEKDDNKSEERKPSVINITTDNDKAKCENSTHCNNNYIA